MTIQTAHTVLLLNMVYVDSQYRRITDLTFSSRVSPTMIQTKNDYTAVLFRQNKPASL